MSDKIKVSLRVDKELVRQVKEKNKNFSEFVRQLIEKEFMIEVYPYKEIHKPVKMSDKSIRKKKTSQNSEKSESSRKKTPDNRIDCSDPNNVPRR